MYIKLYVWVCWPQPPDLISLKAYIPFLPTATAPNQHLSARPGAVAWLSMTGSSRPASTTEDRSVASTTLRWVLYLSCCQRTASFLAVPENVWEDGENQVREERVCRLMLNHNNSQVSPPVTDQVNREMGITSQHDSLKARQGNN